MTKYMITAKDLTEVGHPRRVWIFSDMKTSQQAMEYFCNNKDWEFPEYFEIKDVVYDDNFL